MLVDRLWPRVSARAIRGLAGGCRRSRRPPSCGWYAHQPERFDEFAARYADELKTSDGAAALAELRAVTRHPRDGPATSTARRLRAVEAAPAVAVAAVFVWLGMLLAISFLEAPLKFRAPGVTLQIGLGIGRLVFRALNACELALAAAVLATFAIAAPPVGVTIGAGVAVVIRALAGAYCSAAAEPPIRCRARRR